MIDYSRYPRPESIALSTQPVCVGRAKWTI